MLEVGTMVCQAEIVAFALRSDELPRFNRMVAEYGRGSRSDFLRLAMDVMESQELPNADQVYDDDPTQLAAEAVGSIREGDGPGTLS
jgi:hypothetical protein